MTPAEADLLLLLEDFLAGNDRSMTAAGKIEVELDAMFGEEEPYASLVLALASYSPTGGELLYDEEAILKLMRPVAEVLLQLRPTVG